MGERHGDGDQIVTETAIPGFATLVWVAKAEIIVLLSLLAGVVTYQLLIGRIRTHRLLADASGPISPIRVQLLFSTILIAGDCLLHGGHPTLVDPVVAAGVSSASNLLYLAHKFLKPDRGGNIS